jgi:hypothetical protein
MKTGNSIDVGVMSLAVCLSGNLDEKSAFEK